MKTAVPRPSTIFLKAIIVLIGLGALAFLIWEPQVEGVNANATNFEIYFQDPFLAYAYLASIPFFVALYQGFILLGHIARDRVFSPESVRALRMIKHCALLLIAFVVGGEIWIVIANGGQDDIAGGLAMGIFVAVASAAIATAAAVFERLLRNAVELKSENELTV